MTARSGEEDEEVFAVARAIETYLTDHPRAADTIEGISRWWLVRQQYEHMIRIVQRALDLLVEEGVVVCRQVPGGEAVYSLRAHQS